MKAWVRIGCAAFAFLLTAQQSAFAAGEERLKIAVGQRGSWDTSVSDLGQRAGIFKKHGLVLDILYTSGGGETLQAALSRSVDVGVALGTMGVLGAFAKNAPLRIIGAETTGASDLFWYVRADSALRTFRDAGGKSIAFSTNGSSSHGVAQTLIEQYGLTAKAVATGGPPATFTQVMSRQIDVGWTAVPFGLEQVEKGQIRIIARGDDATAFKGQTVRVLAVHAQTLERRKDAITRYMRAYRETVDWMYRDPAALKSYAAFANISEATAKRVRDQFFPKAGLDPDRILGLDAVMKDAVRLKYIATPLTPAQIRQMIQIPPRN